MYIYIYIYIYTHLHSYIHIHTYIYTYIHTLTHKQTHIVHTRILCMNIWLHAYLCMSYAKRCHSAEYGSSNTCQLGTYKIIYKNKSKQFLFISDYPMVRDKS